VEAGKSVPGCLSPRVPSLPEFLGLGFADWYRLCLSLGAQVSRDVGCDQRLALAEVLSLLDDLRRTFQPLPLAWPLIHHPADPLSGLWRDSAVPETYRREFEMFGWALIPRGLRLRFRVGKVWVEVVKPKARARAARALHNLREERARQGASDLVKCREHVEALFAPLAIQAVYALEREGASLAIRPTRCSSGEHCAGRAENDGKPLIVTTPFGTRGPPWKRCSACIRMWEHGVQYELVTETLKGRYRTASAGKAWLQHRRHDPPLPAGTEGPENQTSP